MIVVEIHVFVRPDKGLSIMKEIKEESEGNRIKSRIFSKEIEKILEFLLIKNNEKREMR